MKKLYILPFILILLWLPCDVSADCPDFKIFFKEVNPAKNTWKFLYDFSKTYQGCNDGVYGEGYSDFVVQSLAKYWDRFDELVSLTKKDPSFQNFVLQHIDHTTDLGDLNVLLKNVREHCPSSTNLFCKEIEKAAVAAIESIEAVD